MKLTMITPKIGAFAVTVLPLGSVVLLGMSVKAKDRVI